MSSGPRGQAPRRPAATCAEVSLFPRRKAGKAAERMAKKGEARPVHIHRKSIEALYGKPQAEAASDLGIALTTLKLLCRKMGIVRWPFQRRPRGAPARSESAPTRTPPPRLTPAESGHAAAPAAARQERGGSCFDQETTDCMASEAQTNSRQDSLCSDDSECEVCGDGECGCQVMDTAPTPVSRSELAHGVTAESIDLGDTAAPGGRGGGAVRGVRAARHSCSRPEQMEYALTGAWLDNLPPSRPDGVWQLHAAWLEPGEQLETEPEFDAVLAHLVTKPMP